MKIIIKAKNGTEYKGKIDREKEKFLVTVPMESVYDILSSGEVRVILAPKEYEIDCCNNCDRCLTPIC